MILQVELIYLPYSTAFERDSPHVKCNNKISAVLFLQLRNYITHQNSVVYQKPCIKSRNYFN